MSDYSIIEWTNPTWKQVAACSVTSQAGGCHAAA